MPGRQIFNFFFNPFRTGNDKDVQKLKTDIVLLIHTQQYHMNNLVKMVGLTEPVAF